MRKLQEGELLWTPSPQTIAEANLERYRAWLGERDLRFGSYQKMWRWSVEQIGDFWESLVEFFGLRFSQRWTTALAERAMPGAVWFPGARLNYAENILAQATPLRPALYYADETLNVREMSWAELRDQTQRAAQALRAMGVQPGDRVAAYLPNIPEALIALLATASIGAIWSSCSPDFGVQGVLDRFQQIEPKVLLGVTGYAYNGKWHDRRLALAELAGALPSIEQRLIVIDDASMLPDAKHWRETLEHARVDTPFVFEQVAFDHPLWILYSSGTTGLPKPIVHGHGGILLEHAKATTLHNDLKPGDRFFWYTSTGWMMWNYLIGGLLSGASIILYNGSPTYPAADALFRLAEQTRMTYFGTSAAFINACIKAEIHPAKTCDLTSLRALGSTGSPLSADGFVWVYESIHPDLALESMSGGTDVCTAFVGGVRTQPVYVGELQGASLGACVQAFDDQGNAVVDALGELVITQPMPSMPVRFWGDADGSRYRASYFDVYPGIWRHGDWIRINQRGGCVIYGRSDSTINRHGIRIGTAELYRAVESFPQILDSLVIDLEMLGRESRMLLFVVLREGQVLDEALRGQMRQKLRTELSPRHIPDDIIEIAQVPYTLSGKKMEVPVRRMLLGMTPEDVAKREAMRNPESLDFFIELAEQLRKGN